MTALRARSVRHIQRVLDSRSARRWDCHSNLLQTIRSALLVGGGGVGERVPPDPLAVVPQRRLAHPLVEAAQEPVRGGDARLVVLGEDLLHRVERADQQVVHLVVVELALLHGHEVAHVVAFEVLGDGPGEIEVDVRVDPQQRVLDDRRAGPRRGLVGERPRPLRRGSLQRLEVEGREVAGETADPARFHEDVAALVVAAAVDRGVHLEGHLVVEPQEDGPAVVRLVEKAEAHLACSRGRRRWSGVLARPTCRYPPGAPPPDDEGRDPRPDTSEFAGS